MVQTLSKSQGERVTLAGLAETVADYLLDCEVNRDASKATLYRYRHNLEGYTAWLEKHGHPTDMDALQGKRGSRYVNDYLLDLKRQGAAPGTRATVYRSLTTFWNWCVKQSLDDEDEPGLPPFVKRSPLGGRDTKYVDPPQDTVGEDVGVPYSPEEIDRLLAAVGSPKSTHLKVRRNRAILLMLLNSGVRRKELCGLLVDDYDPVTGHVTVRHAVAKRTKRATDSRTTAIFNGPQLEVNGYVKLLRAAGKGSGPLFPSLKGGKAFRPDSITQLLEYLVTRIQRQCPHREGQAKGCDQCVRHRADHQEGRAKGCDQCVRHGGVHRLRATWACAQRLVGAPDAAIQEAAGWSDVTMLNRYSKAVKTEASLAALKKANTGH